MSQRFFLIGTVCAFIAVAAGAFGAHSLRGVLTSDRLSAFETAARYQMYHAFGLLAVAMATGQWEHRLLPWAGWLFVTGIVLFSGSLYVLVLSGATWLGALTPIGGGAFLTGWLLLGWGAWRSAPGGLARR